MNSLKNNKIPIIFAINDGYAKYLSTVLVSAILNAKNSRYEFNILSSDLTSCNKNMLTKTVITSSLSIGGGKSIQ